MGCFFVLDICNPYIWLFKSYLFIAMPQSNPRFIVVLLYAIPWVLGLFFNYPKIKNAWR